MEPNKLENEMREKLGKREIQPSAQAWDRLDAMLSVQESKEQKKAFPWMQIAAGLVLFLGLGYFIFNSGTNSIENVDANAVVQTSVDTLKENKSNEAVATTNSSMEEGKLQGDSVQKEIKPESVVNDTKSQRQVIKYISPVVKTEGQMAQNESQNQETIIKNEIKTNVENNQAIAEVKTSAEKPKLKVDPNALLNQIEGEVTLTFRQKVMKSIAKNYKEAKESFASRNEQSSNNQ